jgi:RNA polymerase sigma-70 factor (ECF subfamily)
LGDRGQGRPGGGDDAAAKRLTAGIARGDPAALDEFYRAWFDRVFLLARSLTGRDESFCLDVVQEVMIRVARSIKAMPAQADLERWMMRVVHTSALDQLRRDSRRSARERARDATEPQDPAADPSEQIAWVRERLAELPPEEGWLVWLRFARGKTLAAAGAASGIGVQTAHGRIRRTLQKLRRAGGEVSDGRT